MSNRRRKRSRRNNRGSNIVSSAALIVIAVLLLIFVYFYISNNSFTDAFSVFSRSKSEGEAQTAEQGQTEAESTEEGQTGLVTDADGRLIYVLDENEAALYEPEHIIDKDNRRLLKNSWHDDRDALYYFGEDGYAVDDYSEAAMQYGFDSDYKLSSIRYNDAYISDSEGETSDYPGVVQTKTLWAFIDTEKSLGELCAVKYKKTTESFSHSLGGDASLQYTSRFAMSVADGYIYYAAFCDASDKLTESIANKLFRMKPGADYRELGAENIRGYKVYEANDGKVKVYYDDGHGIGLASRFEKDETVMVFSEDADYYVDYSSGTAVLMLEGGYPVTLASSAFKAGNFTYTLEADGRITAVAAKTKVSTGGYTYTVENGDSFGAKKARVIRSTGEKSELISAEFDGSVGNLHYDYDSSKIIAEYVDGNNQAGLLAISLDGDVDVIYDASKLGSGCTLYAIQDGYAIVKTGDSAEPFKKAKIAASYPLAIGIDPVVLTKDGDETVEDSTSESSASDTHSNPGGNGSQGSTGSNNSKSSAQGNSETAAAPSAETQKSDGTGSGNSSSNGSAGSDGSTTVINNNPVEKKGPGES